MPAARKPVRKSAGSGFSAGERAAMKERATELKAARGGKTDGTADVLAKIAEMPDAERAIAERVHALVLAAAPELQPRTWYGMPAYAKDGKVLCFFQNASKFKSRYCTLGFSDTAALDEGSMWPTSYALPKLTKDSERRITALVKRAAA